MNLISKKDLLAATGISYGQLYRWKRQRLIPEEWFIKQSSYTGQETFLPREQILSRVQSILELKDQYSIEELAKILSPETAQIDFSLDALNDFKEINKELLALISSVYLKESYDFFDIVFLAAISVPIGKNGFTAQIASQLTANANPSVFSLQSTDRIFMLFMAGGEYHLALYKDNTPVSFDTGLQIIDIINLNDIANNLKLNYKNRLRFN